MGDIKLKPCPFCGGEADLYTGTTQTQVFCKNCGIKQSRWSDKADAIEKWNTRDEQHFIDKHCKAVEAASVNTDYSDIAIQAIRGGAK